MSLCWLFKKSLINYYINGHPTKLALWLFWVTSYSYCTVKIKVVVIVVKCCCCHLIIGLTLNVSVQTRPAVSLSSCTLTYRLFLSLSTYVLVNRRSRLLFRHGLRFSLSSSFHLSTFYRIKYLTQVTCNFIDAQWYCSDTGCGFTLVIFTFHWWYDDTYSSISAFQFTRELCLFRRW